MECKIFLTRTGQYIIFRITINKRMSSYDVFILSKYYKNSIIQQLVQMYIKPVRISRILVIARESFHEKEYTV